MQLELVMAPRSPSDRASSDREVSRDYRLLFHLARFATPYRWYDRRGNPCA
ncbi:MAG: hypothetical protein HC869_10175 [Rhodospirillales bacterium]|nr:hypothetical protein [Rhodospirillales bacterium]